MPLAINTEIDLGHLLTIVTVLGAILAWFLSRWRERIREKNDYARSGALRLILRLLRDKNENIVSAQQLFERFYSDDSKRLRKEYCHKNFLFKDRRQFDGALYRLEDEGKVRFDGDDTVVYRYQEKMSDTLDRANRMQLLNEDLERIYRTFIEGFDNYEIRIWDLKDLARVVNRIRPKELHEFLREKLSSESWKVRARATEIIEIVLPEL